jgi:MoaA/NifB/PqqE/SkfB family radical SAM enzyme
MKKEKEDLGGLSKEECERLLLEAVDMGDMKVVGYSTNGEPMYDLTAQGLAKLGSNYAPLQNEKR